MQAVEKKNENSVPSRFPMGFLILLIRAKKTGRKGKERDTAINVSHPNAGCTQQGGENVKTEEEHTAEVRPTGEKKVDVRRMTNGRWVEERKTQLVAATQDCKTAGGGAGIGERRSL